MSDNVQYISGYVPMSVQLFEDIPRRNPFLEAFRAMENARAEREANGHIGPLHGPDKNDLWKIQRKAMAREELLEYLDDLMPGKRPGRFIRCDRSKDYEPA